MPLAPTLETMGRVRRRSSGLRTFVGIDVGTSGVRAVAIDETGRRAAGARADIHGDRRPGGIHEQAPATWLDGVRSVLRTMAERLSTDRRAAVTAVTVVSTSGTIVLSDEFGRPVHPAIMWDDTRATEQVRAATTAFTAALARSTGHGLSGASPVAKLMWIEEHHPSLLASTAHVLTAGDWLAWRLGSPQPGTDPTRGLKLGYSTWDGRWSPTLADLWFHDRLPTVVPSGTVLGILDPEFARACDLPESVALVNGMTDANAAFLAAGAVSSGDWVSTIGTGMSIKALTSSRVSDPYGQVYSHPGPFGSVVVSGTSRCGGAGVGRGLGSDITALARAAARHPAGRMLIYPLKQVGDFFPFYAPDAEGYVIGDGPPAARLRAGLEGLAAVEALAVDRFLELGVDPLVRLVATGGTARSELFVRIRASMLRTPIEAMTDAASCIGAAMLAMAGAGSALTDAVAVMGRRGRIVPPDPSLIATYRDVKQRHIAELERRGYVGAHDVVRVHVGGFPDESA